MQPLTIVITGEIVPYTRVGRERWTARAKRYFSSRDGLRSMLAAEARGKVDDAWRSGRWSVSATFHRYKRRGDLDNLLKAVLDAFEGVLWDNDVQVDSFTARRVACRRGEDRAEITVAPL